MSVGLRGAYLRTFGGRGRALGTQKMSVVNPVAGPAGSHWRGEIWQSLVTDLSGAVFSYLTLGYSGA